MIHTDRISLLSLLLTFEGERCAYGDKCAREAADNGIILTAEVSGEPAGYLCASSDMKSMLITYSYTVGRFRNKGVMTALVGALAELCGDMPLRLTVREKDEFRDAVFSVCAKTGFVQTTSVVTYTCDHDDNGERFSGFMEQRGNSLCSTLERRSYKALPFSKCPDDIIRQIYDSSLSDYANSLDPRPFFMYKSKNLSPEFSYAAIKDGILASYVLTVKARSDTLIYEHISESAAMIGTGAVLLPFCRSLSAAFVEGDIRYSVYAV